MSDPLSRRDLLRGRFLGILHRPEPEAPPPRPPAAPPIRSTPISGTPAIAATLDSLPELEQKLSAMCDARLAPAEIDQLFEDLERHGENLQARAKRALRSISDLPLTLAEARAMLRERSVRSVQIRYRYDGAEWWDTLVVQEGAVRLVRIRHDEAAVHPREKDAGP